MLTHRPSFGECFHEGDDFEICDETSLPRLPTGGDCKLREDLGPEGEVSAAFDDIAEGFVDSGSDGHGRKQVWEEPPLMNAYTLWGILGYSTCRWIGPVVPNVKSILVVYKQFQRVHIVGDRMAGVVRAVAVARAEEAAMAVAEVVGAVTVSVWRRWRWWCAFLVSVLASALS